jgi:transcriptional regulator with XRE-family HTH domain
MSKEIRPFAERLKRERSRLGLSQSELAVAGHISKATQVAYEAGTHVPNLEYLSDVGQLGVDIVYVMTGRVQIDFVESEFDWELLGDITEAIFEWAEEQGRHIPKHKLPDLTRLLYREFAKSSSIDGEVMARALRLAA